MEREIASERERERERERQRCVYVQLPFIPCVQN